jgi:hypothetical protein
VVFVGTNFNLTNITPEEIIPLCGSFPGKS